MNIRISLAALAAACALATGATAVQAQDLPFPVKARQGNMTMMGLNVGVLVGMARGDTEYDAETAQAAADNLVAMASIDQRFHWPEGTDNMTLVGSRALPEIWENQADFMEKFEAFGVAAAGISAVASDGLDPMRAAIGPLGAACNACHDDYQAEE